MAKTNQNLRLMQKYLKLEKLANAMADRCARGVASSEDVRDSWKLANAAYDAMKKDSLKRKATTNG